jgi:hypothetical protein
MNMTSSTAAQVVDLGVLHSAALLLRCRLVARRNGLQLQQPCLPGFLCTHLYICNVFVRVRLAFVIVYTGARACPATALSRGFSILGTFRAHSRTIQGTFREQSRNFQGTFREHPAHIQRTFSAHSGHIKGISRVALGHIQGLFRDHSGHIQGTLRAH